MKKMDSQLRRGCTIGVHAKLGFRRARNQLRQGLNVRLAPGLRWLLWTGVLECGWGPCKHLFLRCVHTRNALAGAASPS